MGLPPYYKEVPKQIYPKGLWELKVDKCIPWGHFDGVFQGQNMAIVLGISFFLSDSHYFHFKENIGSVTNNIGELMDLFYMLKFSLGMGMRSFQVFDDSLMVIN